MSQHESNRLADFFLPVMEQARRSMVDSASEVSALGSTLMASLDQACARALEHGHDKADVDHALFAVVAWLDEMAMSRSWSGAGAWRLAPLQRHYFSTTRAGSEFYQRLDALPETDTAVREVYALALVAGFKGEYGTRPASTFSTYTRQVVERIQSQANQSDLGSGLPLFPGALPGRHLQHGEQGFNRQPMLTLLLIVGIPLVLIALVYLYLDFSLSQAVAALIERT